MVREEPGIHTYLGLGERLGRANRAVFLPPLSELMTFDWSQAASATRAFAGFVRLRQPRLSIIALLGSTCDMSLPSLDERWPKLHSGNFHRRLYVRVI